MSSESVESTVSYPRGPCGSRVDFKSNMRETVFAETLRLRDIEWPRRFEGNAMNDMEYVPVRSTAPDLDSGWRSILRDITVECLAWQPCGLKLWEMRHLRRLILGLLFRLERSKTVVVAAGPAGQRFRMRLSWQAHMSYVLGFYEPELIRTLKQYLKRGDTCIDVGGHVGYLSLIMARLVGPQGRVVSFEPVPQTCKALEENIQLNGLNNIGHECAAVGNSEGTLELVCTKGQELSWTASSVGYSVPGEQMRISVPVVTLDHYLQRRALRPNLIKIDVEGAELSVLRGARRTLQEIRPVVLVEIHDLGEKHKAEALALLEEFGYTVTSLGTRDRELLCLAVPTHRN